MGELKKILEHTAGIDIDRAVEPLRIGHRRVAVHHPGRATILGRPVVADRQPELIGLARALMNDGALLLLDEPMAGVEGAAYETMQRVVREEAASGRAVCVVEHNVSFIKDLCSRAVFMAQGRILETGSVDKLLKSKVLTDLYFGV